MSLTTEIVKARYPADEAGHKVRFWNTKGLLFASSVGGLCYVLTGDRRSYEGCRLKADGQEFTGDEIPAWGAEHLPKSLAIALDIRRETSRSPVAAAVEQIARWEVS